MIVVYKEELYEILSKAAKWYLEYTTFGVFAKENTQLVENRYL